MDIDGVIDVGQTLEIDHLDDPVTIHPAAVETERGVLLVDAGFYEEAAQTAEHLAAAGYDWDDVWGVVLTHQDPDHAGGLADVVDRADPVVFAHRECAPYVDGREFPIKIDGDERFPAARVDVELVAGVRFTTAAGPMDVHHTPGHAPGHVSLHFPEAQFLIAGDALHCPDGTLDGPRGPLDEATAVESIGTLADLEVERTLCHHGGFVEHAADAISRIHADAAGG